MRIKSELFSWTILFLLRVAGLGLCYEQHVPCTVTQGDGWTEYHVPEHQGTDCHFSWSNSSDYVIANHMQQPDPVVLHKNHTSLRIKGCSERTTYLRNCISEGTPRKSICSATCRDLQSPQAQTGGNSRHYWMTLSVSVSIFILVLVLIGVIVRCQKTQNQPQPEDAA